MQAKLVGRQQAQEQGGQRCAGGGSLLPAVAVMPRKFCACTPAAALDVGLPAILTCPSGACVHIC